MKRFYIYCAAFTGFVAVGFLGNINLAIAQQVDEEQTSQAIEEIVEVGVAIERHQVGKTDAIGTKTEIFELTEKVSYADLDLKNQDDVAELEKRIAIAAQESCEKLNEMHPLPPSSYADIWRCTQRAIDGSKDELLAAVKVAN